MANKTITLKAGIEEYLDVNHAQTILLNHIGFNNIETDNGMQKQLSFSIILGENNTEQYMQEGAVFDFQNSSWRVVSINTKDHGDTKLSNSVTFEML